MKMLIDLGLSFKSPRGGARVQKRKGMTEAR